MDIHSKLVSAVDACADRLEYLNNTFPKLATPTTKDGVEYWRQRRIQTAEQDSADKAKTGIDLRSVAFDLLQQHSLEDVLDLLLEKHRVELSLPELVQLIGEQDYLVVLRREFNELLTNAISFEQIATLWNDLDRPALGGPVWTSESISTLAG
jgi:hypothetical protein